MTAAMPSGSGLATGLPCDAVPVHAVPCNQVRLRPDGTAIAWYRPAVEGDDAEPWLVIEEDPVLLGVEHTWQPDTFVTDWIVLAPAGTPPTAPGEG